MLTTQNFDRDAYDAVEAQYLYNCFWSFRFFLREFWVELQLSRKTMLSEVEYDLADYMSASGTCQGISRRRIVLAMRGFGKTTMVVALTCWRLFRDPERRIIIVSKSETHGKRTIRLIKGALNQVWFLQHLAPVKSLKDLDHATYFTCRGIPVSSQPSVSCIGIDGQLEGNRAHSIYPDDVETKSNVKTHAARAELYRLTGEFKNIVYPYRECVTLPNGLPDPSVEINGPIDPVEIVYQGTPKHEESVYFRRHANGYALRSYPIALPDASQTVLCLAPILQARLDAGEAAGLPTLPHRFPREEIIERQAEGALEYAMESMLQANLATSLRYPLTLNGLMVMDVPLHSAPVEVAWGERDHNGSTVIEELESAGFDDDRLRRPAMISKDYAPYVGTRMRIDPSGGGPDKTGVAVGSFLNGNIWVHAVEGFGGGFSEASLRAIAEMARALRVDTITIEDNFGRGMFQQIFTAVLETYFLPPNRNAEFPKGWTCRVESVNATGQKELRIIETLGPAIGHHRLIIDTEAIRLRGPGEPSKWGRNIPKDRHRDRDNDRDNELQYQITRITRDRKSLREDGKIDALEGLVRDWLQALDIDPRKAAKTHRTQLEEDLAQQELDQFLEEPDRGPPRFFRHR